MNYPASHALILILFAACLVAGCGETYYDSMPLAGMVEHVGDVPSAIDLTWALDQHQIEIVAVSGCLPSRLFPGRKNTTEEIKKINDVVVELAARNPKRVLAFPLIRPDDPNPANTLNTFVEQHGAFGAALDPEPGDDLFSPAMLKFFERAELARAPLMLHLSSERFGDLERIARDYPHTILLAPQLAGQAANLDLLDHLLWRYNNIYLGIGFGPETLMDEKIALLAENAKKTKAFFEDHRERICYATETNLTEEPYRNGEFADSQIRYVRAFLERDLARLQTKTRDGGRLRREVAGLTLDKQTLGLIYRFNFMRAVSETAPRTDAFNLNLLHRSLPAEGKFDPEANNRVIGAAVVSRKSPIHRLASIQVKRLLDGKITDLSELGGDPGKLELVSYGPVAEILANKFNVELLDKIKTLPNAEAFADYMAGRSNAIGLCTFDQIDPRLRSLTVDGEAPVNPYVKYCAAKGAGTYGHYFETYPLLLPITAPNWNDVDEFEPHRIRRFALAGPSSLGPYKSQKEERVAVMSPTNDLAPYLRDAGLTIFALQGPIQDNCAQPDCTDSRYIPTILATGIDASVFSEAVAKETAALPDVERLLPGRALSRNVRGLDMVLVGGSVTPADLPELVSQTKAAARSNAIIAAALQCRPDQFDSFVDPLLKAGASAVVNVGSPDVEPWEFRDGKPVIRGLGRPLVVPGQSTQAVVFRLTFYDRKLIASDAVTVGSDGSGTRELVGGQAQTVLRKTLPLDL
jgi:amidohydrolase family protein